MTLGRAGRAARSAAEEILTCGRTARAEQKSPDHEHTHRALLALDHFVTRKQE